MKRYIFSLNLGSLLLLISIINFLICNFLFFRNVLPELKNSILVTAGTSSAFIGSALLAIISLTFFLFYDYGTGIKTKLIFFKAILNED